MERLILSEFNAALEEAEALFVKRFYISAEIDAGCPNVSSDIPAGSMLRFRKKDGAYRIDLTIKEDHVPIMNLSLRTRVLIAPMLFALWQECERVEAVSDQKIREATEKLRSFMRIVSAALGSEDPPLPVDGKFIVTVENKTGIPVGFQATITGNMPL